MPVGAIIGGGLSLAGAVIGSKAQSKAAGKAADTSLQVAQQNNALTRDIYNQNKATLSPFVQRGNAAGNQINALLGLGGTAPQAANNNAQPMPQQQGAQGYSQTFQNALQYGLGPEAEMYRRSQPGITQMGDPYSSPNGGIPMANAPNQFWSGQQPPQGGVGNPAATSAPAGQTAQSAANDAFDIFRNSSGYQFRLGEGLDAVNSGYAGAGTLQSGAAMRGIQDYAQNFASNEFGNYMGQLQNQQGVGLGGASALAGVGQNYAGMVSQNNNSAGTAAANAALVGGANNPFASALGTLGGTILSGGIKF